MAIITLNNRAINRSDTASADQVWTATSATASDFQAVSGGKILQVVTVSVESQQSTTSTSYAAITGMTLNITPAATSSRILLLQSGNIQVPAGPYAWFTIYRDSTDISVSATNRGLGSSMSGTGTQQHTMAFSKIDSPSTTDEITYTVQWRTSSGSYTIYYGEPDGSTTSLTAIEIGA